MIYGRIPNLAYLRRSRGVSIVVGMLVIAGLILFFACKDKEKANKVSLVKVGILYPMTGYMADKGRDSADGVSLAVEEINAAGGVMALGGAAIEIILSDTQGQPDIGMKAAERLIHEDRVVAIIGAYQSSVTKKATQVAEQFETPFIVSISIADIITERGFRYTFRLQPKAADYAREQVRFLSELVRLAGYPVKRVALLHENSDFGTSTALSQKKALRDFGMDLVIAVSYEAEGVKDLSHEVSLVLAALPDAILEVTYLNDSILIRRALAAAGSRIPLIDTAGGTVSPEYVEKLGLLADGVLTLTEFSKYVPGGKALNERFRARFGVDITGDSAYAYQAVWVLKDALERAGSTERKKIRSALAATDISKGPHLMLPAERLHFDGQGQNSAARLFISQIRHGELVPVWPPEYATGKVCLKECWKNE